MTNAEIKEAVRERDGRRCVDCGFHESELLLVRRFSTQTSPKRLDVHRIDPYGEYSLENCVTLCRSCHNQKRRDYEFIGIVNGRKRFRLTARAIAERAEWNMRAQAGRAAGYSPHAYAWRFEILELMALRHWSAADLARELGIRINQVEIWLAAKWFPYNPHAECIKKWLAEARAQANPGSVQREAAGAR